MLPCDGVRGRRGRLPGARSGARRGDRRHAGDRRRQRHPCFALFQTGDTLASRIADQFQGATTKLQIASLFYLGVILLVIGLLANLAAQLIVRRFDAHTRRRAMSDATRSDPLRRDWRRTTGARRISATRGRRPRAGHAQRRSSSTPRGPLSAVRITCAAASWSAGSSRAPRPRRRCSRWPCWRPSSSRSHHAAASVLSIGFLDQGPAADAAEYARRRDRAGDRRHGVADRGGDADRDAHGDPGRALSDRVRRAQAGPRDQAGARSAERDCRRSSSGCSSSGCSSSGTTRAASPARSRWRSSCCR